MAKFFQPKGLAPGIYFDLSNDAYHADPALSHSGMTDILVSWNDYWENGPLNPNRKAWKATDAMKLGERTGMALLEPEKFHRRYYNTRSSKGHPGTGLSSVQYEQIEDAVAAVREVPVGNNYFSNGYPEVTIIWKDPSTGVMLRAKIDYLHHIGAIDFKRIMGMDNWTIGRAVKNQGLDIQRFVYLEAIKAARQMLRGKEPNIRGEVDADWLEAFAKSDDLFFRFLFQRSTPPYIWQVRELEKEVAEEGERATLHAITSYKLNIERYGVEKPPCGDGSLKTISQFHVPRRDYDIEN